jgi:hypothetical protein
LKLECYLDFLRLDETKACFGVCSGIFKILGFVLKCRHIDYISVFVSDIFLVWLNKASFIEDLAVKLEFKSMGFAKVKVIAWIVACDRVSVICCVWAVLTLSFIERGICHIYKAHLVGLSGALIVIVALWAEAYLG